MGVAIIAITVGAWFAYSALKGESLTDVFKGGTGSLDPGGSVGSGFNTATGTGARTTLPDPSTLPPGGTTVIDGKPVANWIAVQVLGARKHGWTGQVTSGVRSRAEQVLACLNVCGNANGCPGTCAKPGTSNHEKIKFPFGAVDITDGASFDAALRRAKTAGDAGPYPVIRNNLPNDPVHRSLTGR